MMVVDDLPCDMRSRLKSAITESGLSKGEVADLMHVSPARISEWLAGTRNMSARALYTFCTVTGANAHWLLFGTGPSRHGAGSPTG